MLLERRKVVPPTRLERVTYGLGNRRSIHLSYGGVFMKDRDCIKLSLFSQFKFASKLEGTFQSYPLFKGEEMVF